jgi:hypothetical protein
LADVNLELEMLLSRRRAVVAIAALVLIGHQSSAQTPPENAMVTPVAPIVVKQSIFDNSDHTKIVGAVVDFVNILRQQGAYLNSEMPVNAIRAYYVDYYLAQVMNGGHSQFIHNSHLQEAELRHIREGLALLKLGPFIDIFGNFEEHVMRDIARAREHGVENHNALDDRFFKLDPYKTLMPENGRWLKSLAEMRVVPDADYQHAMGALITANPRRAERLAERARATIKYRLKQPLFTAAALVAARLNLHSPSLGGGTSEVDPDGKRQTAWGISSQNGRGLLFLGDKEIIYTESYLDDGRRYTDEIARQRRDALFANPANITSMMKQPKVVNREAIRIPASEINAAIEAAAAVPVVEAAELVMSRLTSGEGRLEFLFPLGRYGAEGTWTWRAQSTTKTFEICFVGDKIFVSDHAKPPFLTLTRAELDVYIATQMRGRG